MNTTPTSHSNSETTHDAKNEQQTRLNLKARLDALSPVRHRPTIYKVHNELRSKKDEAYEPTVVAIGPYHSHKPNLKTMEIHKLRYLKHLLQQNGKRIEDCVSAIERFEPEARKCYADPITLSSTEFTEMLVLDGCFIIEFFSRCVGQSTSDEYDHIFGMGWVRGSVMRDLFLFENQVPFFVLYELLQFIDADERTYLYLVATVLLIYSMNFPLELQLNHVQSPTNIKHLLELVHESLVLPYQEYSDEGAKLAFIGSATSLAESNVKFQPTNKNGSMFQMDFENGSIRVPCLKVEDKTESYFRNLIAYEQYFLDDTECHVGDYATLMDCLINTPEDVKLLIQCGIIDNWLGSEKEVAEMFNKLGDGVITSSQCFLYKGEFKKVNEHCDRRWNKWMAILNQNHFSSPWAIISIVAAFVLIVLTFLQTVFAVIK